ncbi:MAG: hypothetical protein NT080_04160 [Spirochaetes bacterium]|nr:hypothetical protein [Spirochaetota bacterium]
MQRTTIPVLSAIVALSLAPCSAEPAPVRTITVVDGLISGSAGTLAVDEALLVRLGKLFTVVGMAGFSLSDDESRVWRGGLGGAFSFGGGFYVDGHYVLAWDESGAYGTHEAEAAFNAENDRAWGAMRETLRWNDGTLSSVSKLQGRYSFTRRFSAIAMYSFAWERNVGFGNAFWLEGTFLPAPQVGLRLGSTLSLDTDGTFAPAANCGFDLRPHGDLRISWSFERTFSSGDGSWRHVAALDLAIR